MVTNVTSLTGNGLKDWLIQRATAVIFAIYSLFLLGYLFYHSRLTFNQWHALFHQPLFQVASLIALFSLLLHTWIGLWTVLTDYIKSTRLRLFLQFLIISWLLGQFLWCLLIVWGR